MPSLPRISSVMTPFPYSVEADETAGTARSLMREHGIHHLPIKSADRLLGLVTDSELEGRGDDEAIAGLGFRESLVVDVSAPLDLVLDEMAARHVDSALVTKAGRLAGILTSSDVCRILSLLLRRYAPDLSGNDAA